MFSCEAVLTRAYMIIRRLGGCDAAALPQPVSQLRVVGSLAATGSFVDPLRKAPRFQAVMRELKFPTDRSRALGGVFRRV
jgi:hypothetical protein